MTTAIDWPKIALAGKTVINIGQLRTSDVRALDKLVKAGALKKWRGYWYPVTGASWGIGSLKTCWAVA